MRFLIVLIISFFNLYSLESYERLKSECADGMRLGYIRKKNCTYCAFTSRIDKSKLYGEFKTNSKCNESRILDSEDYDTSKGCYWRYIKNDKTIKAYEAIAMRNNNRLNVKFKKKNDCEKSLKNGHHYKYYEESFKIYPIGSSKKTRFIKGCTKKTVKVCEKFKGDGSEFIINKLQ